MHGEGVCALEQGERTKGGAIFYFHLLGSLHQTQAVWIRANAFTEPHVEPLLGFLSLNPHMLVVDQREFTISSFPKKLLHSQAIDRLLKNN